MSGFAPKAFAELFERGFVIGARGVGVDDQGLAGFRIFKLHGSFKGESDFGVVENMKENDVVSGVAETIDGTERFLGIA